MLFSYINQMNPWASKQFKITRKRDVKVARKKSKALQWKVQLVLCLYKYSIIFYVLYANCFILLVKLYIQHGICHYNMTIFFIQRSKRCQWFYNRHYESFFSQFALSYQLFVICLNHLLYSYSTRCWISHQTKTSAIL